MSRLTDFHLGLGTDFKDRYIANILRWDDFYLEKSHTIIQWLFPLVKKSEHYAEAPTLTDKDIHEFTSNDALRASIERCFDRMLRFYGFRRSSDGICYADDHKAKFPLWLTRRNHNFLRITRILKCLCLVGLQPLAEDFMNVLELVHKDYPSVTNESYKFWRSAAGLESET